MGNYYYQNENIQKTINEYDKNGNFVGSYKGEISGTGNMSDYQKDVVQGGQGGRENAFQASSVVSTNLDASNVKTENTKYENMDTVNVGNSGSMSGDNIMVNGESVSGKVSWNGDTATIEGTKEWYEIYSDSRECINRLW